MRRALRLALVIVPCVLGCATQPAHDPAHQRLWFVADRTIRGFDGIPGVTPELVIVGYSGGLVAFRRSDGRVAWRTELWQNSYRAAAANIAVEDSTACLDDMQMAGCVDARTGRALWQVPLPLYANPPQTVLDHGTWYYATPGHEVIAVDARTGHERWRKNIVPDAKFVSVIWGVALGGDTLYAATREWRNENGFLDAGAIVAMSAKSGATLWRYETSGQHGGFQGAPVVTPTLLIGNDVDVHVLRAVRRKDGTQAWQTHVGPDGYISAESPPIVIGDTVYSASTDTQMHAVDLATGRTLWQEEMEAGSLMHTAECGGYLFTMPFAAGPLFTLSLATHDVFVVHVLEPGDEVRSRIAVDGGVAYFASGKGVYAEQCDSAPRPHR